MVTKEIKNSRIKGMITERLEKWREERLDDDDGSAGDGGNPSLDLKPRPCSKKKKPRSPGL